MYLDCEWFYQVCLALAVACACGFPLATLPSVKYVVSIAGVFFAVVAAIVAGVC
jgi:hypothetical protein